MISTYRSASAHPDTTRRLSAGAAIADSWIEDVPQGTFSSRALDAAHELAFGWIRAL